MFTKVPDLWRYSRGGKVGKKVYALTITMNVKHKGFTVVNCPNEFKYRLNAFLDDKGYKHNIDGVLEYHKDEGIFRNGGLHLHGLAYNRNPPKNNKDNLFHFHIKPEDEVKGILGYVKYSTKALSETEKHFKELCRKQTRQEARESICESPTLRTTKCLFDD